jgi:ATP-dependent DNA helicase RecG
MTGSVQRLQELLDSPENEHLEFKEAKANFHFDKLVKYCAALANEGGGSVVLGVTDKRPRKVVGSQAFTDLERTKAGLVERLRLRMEAEEIAHPNGRVLVFTAPSRPIGLPIALDGAYWMRAGEDLAPMTPDMLRRIFDESGPDFSAQICPKATLADLDPAAIKDFRRRWREESGNDALMNASAEQMLGDADLVTSDGITYAALILLGKAKSLGRFLAQAEVIFEYRSSEAPGPANQRDEFRQGFLTFFDKLWKTINLRNDKQHYQDGFIMHHIETFREGSVREAILNAVSHRDYRHPGSVFVRQFPRRLEIVSPGGFPTGITPDNMIDKQFARNRRIAESLLRCGFVERSGQGANRMLVECVRDSKPLPDYSRSDEHEVFLRLYGEMQDESFVKYLAKLQEKQPTPFSSHHYLVLNLVRRNQPIPLDYRPELEQLRSAGIVVVEGRGRGVRNMLNPDSYLPSSTVGLSFRPANREERKKFLLTVLAQHTKDGASLGELLVVLPELTRRQLQSLLAELEAEKKVHSVGRTKAARWLLGKGPA